MKYLIILLLLCSCENVNPSKNKRNIDTKNDSNFYTDGYDFPVGKPDAKKYYNAQKFRKNNHLGEDWNGVGGGNTDKGDPVYSVANGYVTFAEDIKGGWGKIVRIIHHNPDGTKVESLYAHCDSIFVEKGQKVIKGEKIGTIGTADGIYLAHLHFEIRTEINMPIGNGYSKETRGYANPSKYIRQNSSHGNWWIRFLLLVSRFTN